MKRETKHQIDLAYLIGVFNVVGIDGLQKEIQRLKEIGMNPHELFAIYDDTINESNTSMGKEEIYKNILTCFKLNKDGN